MKKFVILVTGACSVTARAVVRSINKSALFKNQCVFVGTDILENEYAAYEGFYSKIYRVPRYDHETYHQTMIDIIKRENPNAALVMSELEALQWPCFNFPVPSLSYPSGFANVAISKRNVYEFLSDTNLVPAFQILDRSEISRRQQITSLPFPLWLRDYSKGTTSGAGSFLAHNPEEMHAWITINNNKQSFMLTEYLPGRNFACFLLYKNGRLLKYGTAERIDYLMSKVSISRVTGNTSKGRLLNDENISEISRAAVELIAKKTDSVLNGLLVVDLKEDRDGNPRITEINIRHVAFTSSFADVGANFAEWHLLCILGREDEIKGDVKVRVPENNMFFRDVDGLPILVTDYIQTPIGGVVSKARSTIIAGCN